MAKKTMVGEGSTAGEQSLRGGPGKRAPSPGLMDPRQLLHNLDEVVCRGLSLHPTAIIILQGGRERAVRATRALSLPRGRGQSQQEAPGPTTAMARRKVSSETHTPLLIGPVQQGLLTAELVQRPPPGIHLSPFQDVPQRHHLQ